MEIVDKIKEAFDWLNVDFTHVAMIGIVELKDEDIDTYTKYDSEEETFNHYYEWSCMYSEDSGGGEILMPLIDDKYMKFEFNS